MISKLRTSTFTIHSAPTSPVVPLSNARPPSPAQSIALKDTFSRTTGKGGEPVTKPRNIVVVLDGTNNSFGSSITSMPTLHSFLSAEKDTSLLFYLSGVGTISPTWTVSGVVKKLWRVLDSAIASSLGDQVKRAYQFLSDHYQPGDRIFIFGFSRGAFTARALVGMIQQVGLIFPGNQQSTCLAYDIYSAGADVEFYKGQKLAAAFKRSFSQEVKVHFVGVWDTVSSVGAIIPRSLPFSAGSSMSAHFKEPGAVVHPSTTTVKEVWFAGAHSDIGGGQFAPDGFTTPRLSKLSLRWMIREAFEQGLALDMERLESSPIYQPFLGEARRRLVTRDRDLLDYFAAKNFGVDVDPAMAALVYVATLPSEEATKDALAPRGDALSFDLAKESGLSFSQKAKELSGRVSYNLEGESLGRRWRANWGRSRKLTSKPTLHFSVDERRNASPEHFATRDHFSVPEIGYKLKARFVRGETIDDVKWDRGGWKEESKA